MTMTCMPTVPFCTLLLWCLARLLCSGEEGAAAGSDAAEQPDPLANAATAAPAAAASARGCLVQAGAVGGCGPSAASSPTLSSQVQESLPVADSAALLCDRYSCLPEYAGPHGTFLAGQLGAERLVCSKQVLLAGMLEGNDLPQVLAVANSTYGVDLSQPPDKVCSDILSTSPPLRTAKAHSHVERRMQGCMQQADKKTLGNADIKYDKAITRTNGPPPRKLLVTPLHTRVTEGPTCKHKPRQKADVSDGPGRAAAQREWRVVHYK